MKRQSAGMAILKTLGFILLFYAAQFLASAFVELVIMGLLSYRGFVGRALLEATSTLYNRYAYEVMLLSALFFIAVVLFMYPFPKKDPLKAVSLKKSHPLHVASAFFTGFAVFLGATLFVSVLFTVLPGYAEASDSYSEAMERLTSPVWVEILYVCLAAPLVEELLFRGLILNTLRRSFRRNTAIILCGVAFGLIHGNFYQFMFTAPLGIFLAYIAVKYENVLPCIFMHLSFNSANYLLRIPEFLGYSETHPVTDIGQVAAILFFVACIPVSVLLTRKSDIIRAREIVCHPPVDPYEPKINPFYPPFQTPYRNPDDRAARFFFEEIDKKGEYQNQPNEADERKFMAQIEWIVVGLGNPGEKYAVTRHNAGFIAMDYLALRESLSPWSVKFHALCAVGERGGRKILYMKPQTFMNLSGEAVREAANFYKIPPQRILVLFDDINFEPGEGRIRLSGSAGGHNGIKSIISCLGSEEFPRIKIGVGHVPADSDLIHWVLGKPCEKDLDAIVGMMEKVCTATRLILDGEADRAMETFNRKG